VVRGARENNLRRVEARLPLGAVCAVTGPSGSGKSTLAVDIVYRALARGLGATDVAAPGAHDRIAGAERIQRVTLVDQAPLGRTSRGNAATYTKAWDLIRKRFAAEPAAVALRLTPAHFSFNLAGGRCDACAGEGFETVEMQFLADVRLVCPVCQGRRFSQRVLRVKHRDLSIAELLERSIDEVLARFADAPQLVRALGPVSRLGLGYLRLGQPLSTLSGGEAQRLKLARALGERHDASLFVLDEPSAGLHADEVAMLLAALRAIVQAGGSVIVVEHDLDIVRAADWIVDLGPGAGAEGGTVVAAGPPHQVAQQHTRTGQALRAAAEPFRRPLLPTPRRSRSAGPALRVTRAREHNLREVSVQIPHGELTVVTGPSGSGKSTLAFDVVFAEGQRRFLETLTPYARQFLPTMPRPDADSVVGVPPAIALEQRTARAGPQSTVATVTEAAHYLRLLYAKLGVVHCPQHDLPIRVSSVDQVLEAIHRQPGRVSVLAPAIASRKGIYLDLFAAAARDQIAEAWCDGQLVSTDCPPALARTREHTIDLVIEADVVARRISRQTLERALRWGQDAVKLRSASGEQLLLSTSGTCPTCGYSAPTLDPRWFSFNTKQGRCASCEGAGSITEPKRRRRRRRRAQRLPPGTCLDCSGSRLAPLPRSVRLQGERYHELCQRSVESALGRVRRWRFGSGAQQRVARPIVEELRRRLAFLRDVGLGYVALDRTARSLSGGEMQRLRLAAQLGAGLTGALYVLDEPTIGLHPCDTQRLLGNLRQLVQLGSTVLVVECE
jgi:excinuclease ABC subunit A